MSRRVLVTGASRGIGRATATAFAERGDQVAVHYRHNEADAQDTLARLSGSGHVPVRGDLSRPGSARKVVDTAVGELGGLDVLVNNAGVAPTAANRHRPGNIAWDEWVDAWESMTTANLLGPAHVTWAFVDQAIARGSGGHVVNVGSRGAFRGEPDHPAYAATKAALQAFGQSLATAAARHGISVTSVAPGFIATERQYAKLDGPQGDDVRRESPFGRVGSPEEVAATIVFLASPEAIWASGTVVDLNGASYLHP